MAYQVVEPWRPITESDDFPSAPNGTERSSALVAQLSDDVSIYRIREQRMDGAFAYDGRQATPVVVSVPLTYLAVKDARGPRGLVSMAQDRIAFAEVPEVHCGVMGRTNLPEYLTRLFDELTDLMPAIQEMQDKQGFTNGELETLIKVVASAERYKQGEFTPEDRKLFWLGDR